MTSLRNLTPHAVDICDDHGVPLARLEPDGAVARVTLSTIDRGATVTVGTTRVAVIETSVGTPIDLPDEVPGTVLIVSRLVAEVAGREDLIFPHDLVRDETGAVVGCRSFATIAGRAALKDPTPAP